MNYWHDPCSLPHPMRLAEGIFLTSNYRKNSNRIIEEKCARMLEVPF